jgi:glyoxylase-like metal-dependent hydrolase (beta-lactamase superfamily II)
MSDRLYQDLSWKIGDVEITRLVEVILRSPVETLFSDGTNEALAPYSSWLKPNFIDEDDKLILSIHAFLIRAGGLNIIVDTCSGNGKKLPLFPEWNDLNTPFLENMAKLGFPAESIDRVLCTHLHFDHVGWNTKLVGDQWVPTFPNARYLFGETEWGFWSEEEDHFDTGCKEQAILPVLDAGLADLVDSRHKINDEISLIPTPGHTPGHVSILITSKGEQAIITGDMFHHPCQMAKPGLLDIGDVEHDRAEQTRIDFMNTYSDGKTLILGTHFATPTSGKIIADGDGFRFVS